MGIRTLEAQPLTRDAFEPYGDVIEPDDARHIEANAARFDRYVNLANVDIDNDDKAATQVSIMRCRTPSELPYDVPLLERHRYGSQMFFPCSEFSFCVVVAPASDSPDINAAEAFVTDGRQGINMHRGIWHMPMLGFEKDQSFLVLDCAREDNCDEFALSGELRLEIRK